MNTVKLGNMPLQHISSHYLDLTKVHKKESGLTLKTSRTS